MHVDEPLKIGISSCLLGNSVRYDGSHKRNGYINETLGQYFDFVPLCPEVGIGMGIPRPTIHLVKQEQAIRVVEVKNPEHDYTEPLSQYIHTVKPQLEQLCGYILKKDSPSCGMERVRVYRQDKPKAPPERNGSGIFAASLKVLFPLLPLEEEGRLCDPVLRENFIERVLIYYRWRKLESLGMTAARLVDFHSDHKYILMAHDQVLARELGQLVAQAGSTTDFPSLLQQYIALLMQTLGQRVSRGQHTNVLQHLMGYLKQQLDSGDRQELVEVIDQYHDGYVPLVVPITLLKHHFRRHPQPYIERQYYLNPHPHELMLRNQL